MAAALAREGTRVGFEKNRRFVFYELLVQVVLGTVSRGNRRDVERAIAGTVVINVENADIDLFFVIALLNSSSSL